MLREIGSAIAFLTRLPVPSAIHQDQERLRQSPRWFPFVGLLLGIVFATTAWVLQPYLPLLLLAVLLLVEDAILTGALHLDGLADMADGFGGGHTREDVLRIMRDHSIGAYGAVALILALLMKSACFSDLLVHRSNAWYLLIIPALARWSLVLLSRAEPYARESQEGSGALSKKVTNGHFWVATSICAVFPLVCPPMKTIVCWLATALVTVLSARVSRRRLGGITGDVLGAHLVVCECVQLLVAVVVSHRQ